MSFIEEGKKSAQTKLYLFVTSNIDLGRYNLT